MPLIYAQFGGEMHSLYLICAYIVTKWKLISGKILKSRRKREKRWKTRNSGENGQIRGTVEWSTYRGFGPCCREKFQNTWEGIVQNRVGNRTFRVPQNDPRCREMMPAAAKFSRSSQLNPRGKWDIPRTAEWSAIRKADPRHRGSGIHLRFQKRGFWVFKYGNIPSFGDISYTERILGESSIKKREKKKKSSGDLYSKILSCNQPLIVRLKF